MWKYLSLLIRAYGTVFFNILVMDIPEKWHRLIFLSIDSKRTSIPAWKLTNRTQTSRIWIVKAKNRNRLPFASYKLPNLTFCVWVWWVKEKFLLKLRKYSTTDARNGLHRPNYSRNGISVRQENVFDAFFSKGLGPGIFWFFTYQAISLTRTSICVKLAVFTNTSFLNKNLRSDNAGRPSWFCFNFLVMSTLG